ncbi:hypothetical protein HMPREF3291_23915 [Bacillus sp. HMSC76G11]|uniref:non-specific protein-tyrosine kinase n=1 Tax=Metabacillus idriensis TaxID=324768 RepID=A0A6I2MCI3_9BACI|nr:CpsD/CapB family tyrosine-protein kinase [Metabacillus idriensis]MRX55054.1 polysaccharide biosynthesis tyrosine autokinase [Metabacillus idriensis]OHR71599.1 hypothetical protein HMPREF3291_23915 [Bacillus sp. HMSC76G11]
MFSKSNKMNKINKKLPLDENFISTEQIRLIRSNIENTVKKESLVIMLTSPVNVADKPLIAAKLAIAYAEQNKKVLLADSNFRSPSVHELFNVSNITGLSDLILNGDAIDPFIKDTFINNLSVLTTGPNPYNLMELWVESKIENLIKKCGKSYDVVIIEAPPYLMVSESQILANYCDGVVLVIQEHKTEKEEIIKTKHYLERGNKNILGVIYQTG